MTEAIEKLLDDLHINYFKRPHATGGMSYIFCICTVRYNLFTSCWKDYGIHIEYQKKSGGKYHQMKMLDYEQNLEKIGLILKTIKSCKPNK